MIELEGLSKHYTAGGARVPVLDDVSLDIATGERVAIAGPSGSGKTTLLLLLAGLDVPSAGSVVLDGVRLEDLDHDALADLRCERLGIVFQSFHLVPSLDALDNVALPLDIAGHSGARQRAGEMLAEVGLGTRASHYPRELSGGEQQRVAIARALVHSPALVLADEPTGNLDGRTGATIADLLFRLSDAAGSTLVLVTHDLELAGRCDRVLRVHDGHLTEGPAPPGGDALTRIC